MQLNQITQALLANKRIIPYFNDNVYGSQDSKHSKAWGDYGYQIKLSFENHYQMQRRFGIARAGIRIPPELCWRTHPEIYEGKEGSADERDIETPWESTLDEIFQDKKLWRQIRIADEYQRIGHYGAFVVQVRGNENQIRYDAPLENITADNIVRFIPVNEGQLEPASWDSDRYSERYGQPETYIFREQQNNDDMERKGAVSDVTIHHTRVIVFAEGAEGVDSIYGVPANEAGFNDLITLEKIIGSSGEAMWKSAAMKTVYTNDLRDAAQPSAEELEAMDDAIKDFAEHLDKHLMVSNMKPNTLSANVMDPEQPFNVALNSYSASIGIASKIIIGTQTGRLAADEDGKFTLSGQQSRRENWCTIMVENVVDWLIEHSVVPKMRYYVEWDDLLAPSDSDKLSLAEKMAKVNKESVATSSEAIFTDDEIRQIAGWEPKEESGIEESAMAEGELEGNAEGFTPPQGVRSAAKQGLELRSKYKRGGTSVGIARARNLSNGDSVSMETINRMVSFFARHEKNRNSKKREPDGGPTNGWIAWQLWGGDAGRSWANRIADQED